ncbi:hypothetical protein, partial [Segatella copri]|uniref:hypothetical protein n=1 Tax=Segatella copri TaxID=165179 RepID=UPI003F8AC8A0
MRRFKPAERHFSSVGLRLMEGGRLAIACLPGIANPRNAWRGTFRGKYLIANPRNAWRGTFRGKYLIANPRNVWRGTFRGKYLMIVIIKFKVQILKFKVMTMFKTIDFRA